jgi:hypothetical protein
MQEPGFKARLSTFLTLPDSLSIAEVPWQLRSESQPYFPIRLLSQSCPGDETEPEQSYVFCSVTPLFPKISKARLLIQILKFSPGALDRAREWNAMCKG